MANVLNPEPESITLNTELETPTLDPATELEQPLHESTSNTEAVEALVSSALDADAIHNPAAVSVDSAAQPAGRSGDHSAESLEDFSAALEAFEREQAAEAAAVAEYGDKVVTGTVIKQTE